MVELQPIPDLLLILWPPHNSNNNNNKMKANQETKKIVMYIGLLCCIRATVGSCLLCIAVVYLYRLGKGETKRQLRDIHVYKYSSVVVATISKS